MNTLYCQVPFSVRSLCKERVVYAFNGSYLGSYLEVTSHDLVPTGFYPLESIRLEDEEVHPYERSSDHIERAHSYQFKTYEGRAIHFPLDQQVQMQSFFHVLSPEPIDVLECHPDGNRSYCSQHAVLDAGCTIERLYCWLMSLQKQAGYYFPSGLQYGLYRLLWELYFLEYPDLLRVAAEYDGFRHRSAVGTDTYRPRNTYKELPGSSLTASRAIAQAVWHYQHSTIWEVPPTLRVVAQHYWRQTHDEPFPSDQVRQQILLPGEVVVLAPGASAE